MIELKPTMSEFAIYKALADEALSNARSYSDAAEKARSREQFDYAQLIVAYANQYRNEGMAWRKRADEAHRKATQPKPAPNPWAGFPGYKPPQDEARTKVPPINVDKYQAMVDEALCGTPTVVVIWGGCPEDLMDVLGDAI